MSTASKEQIEAALAAVVDPYLGTDLVSAKAVKNVAIADGRAQIHLELGYPCDGYHDTLKSAVVTAIQQATGTPADVQLTTAIVAHAVQSGTTPLPQVKNIIAVASGKGGVGKSTVSVNLALALQAEGAQAAILDADIYGPSQPLMLGVRAKAESTDGKTLEPLVSYGVQMMSIGNLIDEEQPMIWRGPMVTSALQQMLNDTRWLEVDYLIVDLPPGTGDIQLTLCQKIPVSAALIVTTPQDIALLDARRALKMFEKVGVPVVGIVENMSTHICSQCGHEEAIFGQGGGASMAAQYHTELLGALPLDIRIREGVDQGKPTVAMEPDSHIAGIYRDIARKVAAKLSLRAKDYSAKFPKIVIQKN